MSHLPIPVHLITGPLGVGKTTAIARLLSSKPADEYWLVVLNEFTDTGVDALTLAMSAQGSYDLRLIPGGCLCCTGEADFRQQMSALLAGDPASWPKRILIEPSGIGHPGAIIEELRLFERTGAVQLRSTVALVDPARLSQPEEPVMAAQVAAADVLLLAKADQAQAECRERFQRWAAQQFPPKRYIGFSEHATLPAQALVPPAAEFEFQRAAQFTLIRPADHTHAHEHAPVIERVQARWHDQEVLCTHFHLLNRHAYGWQVAGELLFDEALLRHWWQLPDDAVTWAPVQRFKAVVRVGIESWLLLQRWPGGTSVTDCDWHQGSRLEVQLRAGTAIDWQQWSSRLQSLTSRCPVG